MLHEELELERSLNDGLVMKFEELRVQHDTDSESIPIISSYTFRIR